ncbi:MAG: NifU family protein [Acidobacteria bacterium]|nr:NifU family protein [Acidobacteriota bacterium]
MSVEQEIKIVAEVDKEDIAVCRFTVDRPVYAGRVDFARSGGAKGVPLAEKLFEIEDITQVSMFGPVVVVSKLADRSWREIGKQVGAAIREYLKSGMGPTEERFQASLAEPAAMRKKIQELFDAQINPGVATHGGWVELIDVKDNNVYLRMGGGCQGCGMADVTLKQGIEALIREKVPEVWQVLDVTDHAGGTNPYYEPAK